MAKASDPVVPRVCDACGYKRYAREVPEAPVHSPLLTGFPTRRRLRKQIAGMAYDHFARCPACGSDKVRTADAGTFTPTIADLHTRAAETQARLESSVAETQSSWRKAAEAKANGQVVLACPGCGARNRVKGQGKMRCGSCGKDFIVTRTTT